MARFDKVNTESGAFRADLAGPWSGSPTIKGMGLDANGRAVPGAGNTGIVGVICDPEDKAAGDRVDLMKDGEIVEFGGVAGTVYTADTVTGVVGTTAPDATHVRIGHTVEADRLIVGVSR